jgi:hypothetical protein
MDNNQVEDSTESTVPGDTDQELMSKNSPDPQDTGESQDLQVKASSADSKLNPPDETQKPITSDLDQTPKWLILLGKFHDESNGLLAGKENLKIVATNLNAKPSFYRKWSFEANQSMRLTASLRRRIAAAKK